MKENRRNFLKRCSLIPFVGSLAFVSKAGASEVKSGLSLAELIACKDELDAIIEAKKCAAATVEYNKCMWRGKLKCGGQNGTLCFRCRYGGRDNSDDIEIIGAKCSGTQLATKKEIETLGRRDWRWRFYINGKEVDVSRAVDEYGALRWPFQGTKKGDLCTAKSPTLSFRIV